MSAIATSWKAPLAVIAMGLALLLASMRVGASRSEGAAAQETQATTPAPGQRNGEPPSNEIADFPQLD
jgi:hypothetical protein